MNTLAGVVTPGTGHPILMALSLWGAALAICALCFLIGYMCREPRRRSGSDFK